MAQLLAAPYSYFTDSNGNPLSGGKVYTYAAGTTTPKTTYTDSGGTTPAANPIILDSDGRATIWLVGYYKIVVKNSSDVTQYTTDNVSGVAASGDMTVAIYDPATVAEQVLGKTAIQTVTNKSLVDSSTYIIDESDNTKKAQFQASSITTATTRTYTLPDKNGTVAMTSDIPSAAIVQQVSAVVTSTLTGATAIPYDDTIPQITEGDEYITVTITPTSSTNKLEFTASLFFGEDANNDYTGTVALFQDSTANALFAMPFGTNIIISPSTTASCNPVTFIYRMTAGTTSATTFKIRAGWSTASTLRLNGSAGGRKYGGVAASSLTVKEMTQ